MNHMHIPPPRLRVARQEDPAVAARQRLDDYSSHVVPPTARVPRTALTMSYWSLLSAMVWMFYGALVAGLYGTRDAFIAIVLAIVAYSLVNTAMTSWSLRTGLNSTLLSRRMFGVAGAFLTAALVAANTTYYAVFESSTLAVAFREQVGGGEIKLWYLIVVVGMLPLMFGGVQTWMGRFNAALLPFFLAGLIACVVTVTVRYDGFDAFLDQPGVVPESVRGAPGWLLGFSLLLGLSLLMPTTADFARLGRPEDERFHRNVTFGWVFNTFLLGVNGLAGAYIVGMVLPASGPSEAGVVVAVLEAMGVVGLLFIVVTQVRINSLNYYLASANWERLATGLFGLRLRRTVWVVVVTVAAFALMLTDVLEHLQTALNWQSAILVPWFGIVCTHFLMSRQDAVRGPEFRAGRLPLVTPGLVVWLIGAALGICLTEIDGVPAAWSGLSAIVSLGVSVVLYAAVLLWASARDRARGPYDAPDPRDEVEPWRTWITCASCDEAHLAQEFDRDPHTGDPLCDECATRRRLSPASARHDDGADAGLARASAASET